MSSTLLRQIRRCKVCFDSNATLVHKVLEKLEYLDFQYSWTFITALFFTATLLTTIGYGNLVPVTWHGRMFCIAYALLGVPLILITVADIGKFLSENIIWLYSRYSKARKNCRNHNYTALPTKDDRNRDGEQLMPKEISTDLYCDKFTKYEALRVEASST
ncbi:unnamed protein product, partial [Cylicostephanus goldi]